VPTHERPFTIVKRVPLAVIDAAICARLGLAGVPGNAQPAAFHRQIAMYLARHVGGWSATSIGKFYSGRDHRVRSRSSSAKRRAARRS
jgi:hypothetical protein